MCLKDQAVTFHSENTLDNEFLAMTDVLFEDEHMALVNAQFADEGKNHVLLFDKILRRVLTENFNFWSVQYGT